MFATDWQSHIKKTWEFKAETGTVEIVLLAFPKYPNVTSLEIIYKDGASPSIAEEVGFIREVVRQLPSLGYHVNTLSNISMRGFREPEVRERVAIAALHSKEWQSFTKVVGGAEQLVENLLNSTGVYDAFNSAKEAHCSPSWMSRSRTPKAARTRQSPSVSCRCAIRTETPSPEPMSLSTAPWPSSPLALTFSWSTSPTPRSP
jgi:hypothetical protein